MDAQDTKDLAVIKAEVVKLADMQAIDLADKNKVEALVATALEIGKQKKEISEQDSAVKSEFKRMTKQYTDEGHNVTCYAYDQECKMTVILKGGGKDIDGQLLMEEIYKAYGEEVGDRGGRAWKAYCAVTDPVEAPRVINQDKLTAELLKNERIASNGSTEEVLVSADVVQKATVDKAPTIAASCSKMSAAEKKAHKEGNLDDIMVVK